MKELNNNTIQTYAADKKECITQANVKQFEKEVESSLDNNTTQSIDIALQEEVTQMIDSLFLVDLSSASNKLSLTNKIEELGDNIIKRSSSACSLLNVRIGALNKLNDNNDPKSEIITTIEDLNYEMKKLDPSKINFDEKGLFGKISRSIKKYFEQYKTADAIIKEIFDSLEKSKKRLESDNKTLEIKQVEFRNVTLELKNLINYLIYLNNALEERLILAKKQGQDEEVIHFIETNIVFIIVDKINNLQTQLTTNQNGYVALEILIQNNKVLLRNAKNAQTTTRSAIETAIIVASALYDQKITLKQIDMLNSTTNHYISQTSKLLKSQGTAIQKQAIESGGISTETLKEAFTNTFEALEEINTFKQEAIPLLRARIDEFSKLIELGESKIKEIEKNK